MSYGKGDYGSGSYGGSATPAATRLGDNCTGHGCWPSRPSITGSQNVFVNSLPLVRQTDQYATHCCLIACHDGALSQGSMTVFANDLQAGRIGDPISCGSSVMIGSENVFIG